MKNTTDLKVMWLRERFRWMGQHSGYDLLCETIADVQPANYLSVWRRPDAVLAPGVRHLLWRLAAKHLANPHYNLSSTRAELDVLWKNVFQKSQLLHLTYVENQLGILKEWGGRLSGKKVGTVHQPPGWWRLMHTAPECLSVFDAVIVCGSREVEYFERYVSGQVYFVPYGVDSMFFRPDDDPGDTHGQDRRPRCVFVGKWLRDLQTLARVIEQTLAQNPNIQFDLVIPKAYRDVHWFYRIARYEQVAWHEGLADHQLRQIYQQATLLLLPLLDCIANSALVEAMACGVPVVTNDVGAVRDYAQEAFADILPVGDVDGMSQAILRLVNDPNEQQRRGRAARTFVEQHLAWETVALQTLNVYRKVLNL